MKVAEVKIRLASDETERLRGFCTVTLDSEFVVRDIKVIEGLKGLFVAMPSRKVTDHCPKCRGKNHLRARYCNDCGAELPGQRAPDPSEGSGKLHIDVAHPINSDCRNRLQSVILAEYEKELQQSRPSRSGAASPEPTSNRKTQDTEAPPQGEALSSFGEGLV